MAYKSLESMIRNVLSEEVVQEASLGDHKGLMALAKRKTGDEKDAMMRTADMMKKGQIKDLNMFMKAMDKSTHKAVMPFFDKKHDKALHEDIEDLNEANPTGLKIYHKDDRGKTGSAIVFTAQDAQRRHNEWKKAGHKATHHALMYGTKEGPKKPIKEELDLSFLEEKKLTPAELKKREDVAKAIERDDPDMPMDKKMAIATATAKKVAEETEETNEAVGTAAKYAGRSGFVGGKFKSHDRAMELPRQKLDQYRAKQQGKKDAAHKAQDPSMAKRGYAQNVVDRNKAQRKAAKKGLGHQSISYQQGNSIRRGKLPEANDVNEVRGGADEPDKHIVMQLRKAQDVDGNHPVTFRGGKQAKVAKKHIDKILKIHDHPSMKPDHKRKIRVAISKSPKHLATFADRLKEDSTLDEATQLIEMNIDTDVRTPRADYKLGKVRLPDGRTVYRKVKREIKVEK